MFYLDANIVYPMFAITAKRQKRFESTGTSGNSILDRCITLIQGIDNGKELAILSDLAVLETLGVASRDVGFENARKILKAIFAQKNLEVIQTTQHAWIVAKSLTVLTSIEARDSLHLANALLSQVVTTIITSDKDFREKGQRFLDQNYAQFSIPPEIQAWYQITEQEKTGLHSQIQQRALELGFDLVTAH